MVRFDLDPGIYLDTNDSNVVSSVQISFLVTDSFLIALIYLRILDQ